MSELGAAGGAAGGELMAADGRGRRGEATARLSEAMRGHLWNSGPAMATLSFSQTWIFFAASLQKIYLFVWGFYGPYAVSPTIASTGFSI